MPDFQELLDKIRAGGDDLSPTVFDDLAAEHHKVVSGFDEYKSSSAAKMDELTSAMNQRDSTISDLKARNYDLLSQAPTEKVEPKDESKNEGPAINGIDDLFGK